MAASQNSTTTTAPKTPKVPKAPRWTALPADRAAWIAANARPAIASCLCGCGETTKGRFFPGHDATLKETLKVTVESGDKASKASATAALATFGW